MKISWLRGSHAGWGRTALWLVAAVALIAANGAAVAQEEFPSKAVEVITHAGTGGGTDITTRMMLLKSRKVLGADMVIVNKRGGRGVNAHNYLVKRPRDGYAISSFTASHIISILTGKSPLKIDDIVGVVRATDDPQIIMVNAKSPYKTAQEFIAAQKTKKMKYGVNSVGSLDHMAAFTFARKAGIMDPVVVPFGSPAKIVVNLVGGNIDAAVMNLSEGLSQVKSGEIRPMVVLAEKRMKPIPDAQTAKEVGVDAVASTIRGFFVLKGTPPDRIKKLEQALIKGMDSDLYQRYLDSVGLDGSSIAGTEVWDAQIKQMAVDMEGALRAFGTLK